MKKSGRSYLPGPFWQMTTYLKEPVHQINAVCPPHKEWMDPEILLFFKDIFHTIFESFPDIFWYFWSKQNWHFRERYHTRFVLAYVEVPRIKGSRQMTGKQYDRLNPPITGLEIHTCRQTSLLLLKLNFQFIKRISFSLFQIILQICQFSRLIMVL